MSQWQLQHAMTRELSVGLSEAQGDAEKAKTMHLECQQLYPGLSLEDAEFLASYPIEKQKKVIRKVDVSNIEIPMILSGLVAY
jgi:hypothetical protein